ncbi:MAG: hypothetical protein DSY47_07025, partial [Hydrogenothermus sp.]
HIDFLFLILLLSYQLHKFLFLLRKTQLSFLIFGIKVFVFLLLLYHLINGIANNIQYYQNKLEDLKVVIVAHGNSYKFFLKDLSNTMYKNDKEVIKKQKLLYQRLKNLVEFYGVKIEICEVGMKARGLKKENLYEFVKPIYTALTGLVEWQNKGYAYMIVP